MGYVGVIILEREREGMSGSGGLLRERERERESKPDSAVFEWLGARARAPAQPMLWEFQLECSV